MSTSRLNPNDRARQFIDDVLKINAEYGMRSVKSEDAYETAVADAARSAALYGRAPRSAG